MPIRQPYWLIPDPTPSCRGSSVSIRNASITTSNVAPAAPTRIAAVAVEAMLAAGSISARLTTAATTSAAVTISQDTRWPSRPITGRRTPSTTHAHKNFKL